MNKNDLKNVSLSHATMRNEDLIPAFAEFLEYNFPEKYKELQDDEDYYYILEFGHYDTETAYYLLDELFDILNDDSICPDGYYFGSHVGDGSDYGFWKCEDF